MIYLKYSKPNKTDRTEMSLEGRRLLNELLSAAGEPEVQLSKDTNGRPYIIGRKDLDFNISHSDTLVVCALSVGDGRVGVDAEPEEPVVASKRQERFAERFFSENEKRALACDMRAFSRIWTSKEAYLKREGVGLSRELASVDIFSLPAGVKLVTFEREGHFITLCLDENAKIKII